MQFSEISVEIQRPDLCETSWKMTGSALAAVDFRGNAVCRLKIPGSRKGLQEVGSFLTLTGFT